MRHLLLALRSLRAAVVGLLALAVASPAWAGANLLANPDFPEAQILPWKVDMYGAIQWSPGDASGVPGSGSLRIIDNRDFYAPFVTSECVPVTGGAQVVTGGQFRAVANNSSSARIQVRLAFWSSTDCKTGPISEISSDSVPPSSSWSALGLEGTAPATAKGTVMRILASSGQATAPYLEVEADKLSVSHDGSLPQSPNVFLDGFEAGGLLAWTLVVGN